MLLTVFQMSASLRGTFRRSGSVFLSQSAAKISFGENPALHISRHRSIVIITRAGIRPPDGRETWARFLLDQFDEPSRCVSNRSVRVHPFVRLARIGMDGRSRTYVPT